MKIGMNKILLLAGLLANQQLLAVSETQSWQEDYQFDRGVTPRLVVKNVWGDVRVSAHSGRTIKVSVHEKRIARDSEMLAESQQLLYLDIVQTAETLELVVDGINRRRNGWRSCRGCRLELQFDIQVPETADLEVGTVNDGEVYVTGIRGQIDAHNVNGDVTVEGLQQCGSFKTINGEIDIDFARAPEGECRFKTINGDITARLPASSGADLILDVTHGRISSDFELTPLAMQPRVEKSISASGGTQYRFTRNTGVRIGSGGAIFQFESLNGDIKINQNHRSKQDEQ